jgi:hypothetical protein
VGHSKIPTYLSIPRNEGNHVGVRRDSCSPSQDFHGSHIGARTNLLEACLEIYRSTYEKCKPVCLKHASERVTLNRFGLSFCLFKKKTL